MNKKFKFIGITSLGILLYASEAMAAEIASEAAEPTVSETAAPLEIAPETPITYSSTEKAFMQEESTVESVVEDDGLTTVEQSIETEESAVEKTDEEVSEDAEIKLETSEFKLSESQVLTDPADEDSPQLLVNDAPEEEMELEISELEEIEEQAATREENIYHTVVRGDSLWRISRQYNTTVDQIVRWNHMSSQNQIIHPGDRLIVGKKTVIVEKDDEKTGQGGNGDTQYRYHTVVRGDSLWRISRTYSTTVDQIVKWNNMSSQNQMIHPGDRLIVGIISNGGKNPDTPNPGKPKPDTPKPVDNSVRAKQQRVVNEALKHQGTRYTWGGRHPSTGFDCSGFAQYVYRQALGIEIGSWTVPQEKAGREVSLNALQPGDLIFWGPRGGTTHVAISLGGNRYIHAPQPGQTVGQGTIYYNIGWSPTFARRVIV